MEKEKRKGRPRRRLIIAGVLTFMLLLLAGGFWAWSWVTTPRSLSDLSRFETEEEVLAFLHQNLEINTNTKNDVLEFVDAYPIAYGECRESIITEEYRRVIDTPDDAEARVSCEIPTWGTIAGTMGYFLIFYFDTDEVLVYINTEYYCHCL